MCSKKSWEQSQNDWINLPSWGIVREFHLARAERGGDAVALSQDEQRMLAEIERRLSAEDPRLASRLSSFRRPGPGGTFRTPRGRIIGSLFAVALVAVVSMMVYAMVPFHAHGAKTTYSPQASTSAVSSHYAPSSAAAKTTAGQSATRSLAAKAPSARSTNPAPATSG